MKVPAALQSKFDEISAITDMFCQMHLNDEYGELCRRMIAMLCRKRPSPVTNGKAKSWACGIAYSIGRVNFLFDKNQTPHMRADDLCTYFNLSSSTGSARSKAIMDTLHIGIMDPHWTLPSQRKNIPLFIQVNGMIVDARHLPPEIQEEAFRKGIIPYLP